MAENKRDLLDELIDIQADWNALSHTGTDIVDQLTADPDADANLFDPADYKERPRANSVYCVSAASKNPSACTRCIEVCPTDAISIEGGRVSIADTCNKCGLCVAVCPTEVFTIKQNAPMALYDKVARAATAYEQCYITCARAIGRKPKPNEIVLPCVGALAREVWFNLLCEYPNLSVYLPFGICDDCRTTTGEQTFAEAIADAEEWSGETVGLEMDERDLNDEQKRSYKRSQFVSGVTQAGTRLVSRGVPVLAGAQAVAKRLQDHSKQITEMQKTLERAVGSQNTQSRRRTLTRKRRLLMAGLQKYPDLADELVLEFPQVDAELCTMCGDCAKACAIRALELSKAGQVIIEQAYCVNCGACAVVCDEGAITMMRASSEELVVPDDKAEEQRRKRERVAKLKAQGEKGIQAGLDALQKLGDE